MGPQRELRGIAYEVLVGLEIVDGVSIGALETQFEFELIVPLDALLVVVVVLQDHCSEHGIGGVARLVPVGGDIVLHKLQAVVA